MEVRFKTMIKKIETDEWFCCCMDCGDFIPLEEGETIEEQKEWYNEDDELKLCASCEKKYESD